MHCEVVERGDGGGGHGKRRCGAVMVGPPIGASRTLMSWKDLFHEGNVMAAFASLANRSSIRWIRKCGG